MTDRALLLLWVAAILGSLLSLEDCEGKGCGSDGVGVNYGTLGNDLPDPRDVARLLSSSQGGSGGPRISRIKLFGADEAILRAFAGTGIEVIVGVLNEEVAALAGVQGKDEAEAWLQSNVLPYLPETRIMGIAVGNEIMGGKDKVLEEGLVKAMMNLQGAVEKLIYAQDTKMGCYGEVQKKTTTDTREDFGKTTAKTITREDAERTTTNTREDARKTTAKTTIDTREEISIYQSGHGYDYGYGEIGEKTTTDTKEEISRNQSDHDYGCSSRSNRRIIISSPVSLSILGPSSFPPSSASILNTSSISPFLSFLSLTSSPFMANIYPFFAYISSSQSSLLNYSLFLPTSSIFDPLTSLHYTNMFDAQVDALVSAISGLGFSNLSIVVSETGWPSRGDPDQPAATLANAQTYTNNLIEHVLSCRGTPLRPNNPMDTYIFALFNENMKPGPTSERNYGLFKPDMTPVYTTSLSVALPTVLSLHSSPLISPPLLLSPPVASPNSPAPSEGLLVSSTSKRSKRTPFFSSIVSLLSSLLIVAYATLSPFHSPPFISSHSSSSK